jgi:hypothetical protein
VPFFFVQVLKLIMPRFLAFLSADYGRWARGEARDSRGGLVDAGRSDTAMDRPRGSAPLRDASIEEF